VKPNRKHTFVLLSILAFALVARLLYLFAYREDPFASHLLHDAGRYQQWASTLASGQPWETGAFYQAPLYPYLVAWVYRLTAAEPLGVYVLQLILGVTTIFLVYRVTRRAYDELAGLAAAAIVALYAPLVFFETKLLSVSIAVFLAALLIERMQDADTARRDQGWLIPGIVLGLAALTHAGLLLMGPLGAGWIILDRQRALQKRLLRIASFVLGATLVILPVTIRNHRASGEWILISTNGGITCYQGNNPNAVGVFSTPPGFSGRIEDQQKESRRLAEQETGTTLRDGALSSFYFRKAGAFLVDDPGRAARLFTGKLLLAVANEEQPLEYNPRLDENPFRWLFPTPFALMVALAAIRVFSRRGDPARSRAEMPILLLVLTEATVLVIFYVSGRYRLPVVPGLAALAGCGLVTLWRGFAEKDRRIGVVAAISAAVAVISFAYVPLAHGDLRNQQLAMGHLDRATALWETGHHDDAVDAMRRSLALDPVFAERHLNLAQVLYRLGRIDEAEIAARDAVERDPESLEALFLYGVLCTEQRRLDEAATVFSAVLLRDPTRANAANNLLGVLIQLGRTDEARRLWHDLRGRGVSVDPSLDERMQSLSSTGK